MKRKGFTLVELLAVLAVLAIMIILVLPNVLKLFNDSKKKSFETEIKEIYKTAQEKWMMESLHKKEERYYSRTVTQECVNQLNLSGRTDLDYFIKLDKKGNVVLFKAKDANYQYYYSGPGLKIDELKDVVQISKIDDDEVLIVTCSGLAPNYYNVTLDKKYEKLQDAIDEASSNQTIKLLGPIEYESTPFVVPEDMNPLIIDFNGYVLVYNYQLEEIGVNNGNLILTNSNNIDGDFGFEPWSYMTNNGTLTIKKGAGVNSENDAIINNGTLNIEGGTINGREASAITNNGTINMSSGYVGAYITGIDNKSGGVVNITGGEVGGIYALHNSSGAQMSISNGAHVRGFTYGIYNNGTLTTNNCTITSSWVTDPQAVINDATATLTNTDIIASTSTLGNTVIGIKNNRGATLTYNSGTITATMGSGTYVYGIDNEGTFIFNNGTLKTTSRQQGAIQNP